MPQSVEEKVLGKIRKGGKGWAFSPKDFLHLGSRKSVDMALSRLTEKSAIRRVIRGIYDSPRHSDLLGCEMGPDLDQVAKALARKFGWRIQPSGAVAANFIGLSTQVPSQYLYQSDGPDRSYEIGSTELTFKHAALKEFGFKADESAVVVQALKHLGEDHLSDEVIQQTRDWLKPDQRQRVLKDTERVTGWVYEAIRKVCREDSDG
ncbi:MAG: DUF6088 family protein [Rubripirellula sp.]